MLSKLSDERSWLSALEMSSSPSSRCPISIRAEPILLRAGSKSGALARTCIYSSEAFRIIRPVQCRCRLPEDLNALRRDFPQLKFVLLFFGRVPVPTMRIRRNKQKHDQTGDPGHTFAFAIRCPIVFRAKSMKKQMRFQTASGFMNVFAEFEFPGMYQPCRDELKQVIGWCESAALQGQEWLYVGSSMKDNPASPVMVVCPPFRVLGCKVLADQANMLFHVADGWGQLPGSFFRTYTFAFFPRTSKRYLYGYCTAEMIPPPYS